MPPELLLPPALVLVLVLVLLLPLAPLLLELLDEPDWALATAASSVATRSWSAMIVACAALAASSLDNVCWSALSCF